MTILWGIMGGTAYLPPIGFGLPASIMNNMFVQTSTHPCTMLILDVPFISTTYISSCSIIACHQTTTFGCFSSVCFRPSQGDVFYTRKLSHQHDRRIALPGHQTNLCVRCRVDKRILFHCQATGQWVWSASFLCEGCFSSQKHRANSHVNEWVRWWHVWD